MTRRAFAGMVSYCVWAQAPMQDRSLKPQLKPAPLPGSPIVTANGRRAALLIGNNSYKKAPPLQNAIHDASDLAAALRNLNFEVHLILDADMKSLSGSIQKFSSSLRDGNVAFFFYAGH